MRKALEESIAASPVPNSRGYVKGSIICCVHCARPLFKLIAGIGLGEPAGRGASKLRPVGPRDLQTLAGREDVSVGLRAFIKTMTWAELMAYAEDIPVPKAGDPCICPKCQHVWVAARAAEQADAIDRAFVLELHAIPPDTPPARMTPRPGQSPFMR